MNKPTSLSPAIWAADFSEYPHDVLRLMGLMEVVPLATSDLRLLAGQSRDISQDTQELLRLTLPHFAATGAHMRMGLCSFKTGPAPMLPIFTADQAITTLRMRNRRVSLLATQILAAGREGALYLRPYREIPRWCEFRMFIRDRKVIGISQYHLDQRYPEIMHYSVPISQAIAQLTHHLLPALHVPDIVADIAVDPSGHPTALLIELNPFLARTGACLFSWANPQGFDGSFRVL